MPKLPNASKNWGRKIRDDFSIPLKRIIRSGNFEELKQITIRIFCQNNYSPVFYGEGGAGKEKERILLKLQRSIKLTF